MIRPYRLPVAPLAVVVSLSIVLAAPAHGQLLPPAPVSWQDLSTPHFVIHHARGSEELAARLASIAETTYERYQTRFGLVPPGRVQVYLQEAYDLVNSAASPPEHLSIYVFPDPPYGIPYAEIGHYHDWLELAFVHEYMHIVDLEQRRRAWKPIHVLTGLGYPNLLRPLWTIEGVAVWAESRLTGGGRIDSPSTEMVIRADVLEGRWREMADWSGAYEPWPSSTLSYLYGGSYFQYLEKQTRENAPIEFRRDTAGRLPFGYDESLHAVGVFGEASFQGFRNERRRRADQVLEDVEARGPITEGENLGRPGTAILDLLPTTSGVVVAALSDVQDPHLWRRNPSTGTYAPMLRIAGGDVRLARGAQGRIVFSDLGVRGNTKLQSQIYAVDADGHRHRISPARRVHEPAVSPDGARVVACQRVQGRSYLVAVDAAGAHRIPAGLPDDADAFDPHWSPDGRHLVLSVWQVGRQDLWLVDVDAGQARRLTQDEHWNIQPTFAPDGRTVAFASDRSGVWNVYAIDVASGWLRQLTNVTTGAFLPEFSPDGAFLYFSRYTPEGDELRRLAIDAIPALDATLPPTAAQRRYLDRYAGAEPVPAPVTTASRPRSSWRDLRFVVPIGALPVPTGDEHGLGLGLVTFGADPLSRFAYTAMGGYGFDSQRVSYDAGAAWSVRRGVTWSVRANDLAQPTSADLTASDEAPWRRDRVVETMLQIPFLNVHHAWWLGLGGRIRDTDAAAPTDHTLAELPAPKFYEGRAVELTAQLGFDNAQRHPLSFSPENGVRLAASTRRRVQALDGARTGTVYEADLRGYLRVADPVVLAARALGVRGEGREVDFSPFGDLWIPGLDRTFGASRLAYSALEVRFRVMELQEKAGWDAIYLHRIHGAVFAHGARLQDEVDPRRRWTSVGSFGARGSIDVTLGYVFPMTFSLEGTVPSHGEATLLMTLGSGF